MGLLMPGVCAGSLQIVSPTSVGMGTSYGPRTWTFDHIAGPETSQEAFFTGPSIPHSGLIQDSLSPLYPRLHNTDTAGCACTLQLLHKVRQCLMG